MNFTNLTSTGSVSCSTDSFETLMKKVELPFHFVSCSSLMHLDECVPRAGKVIHYWCTTMNLVSLMWEILKPNVESSCSF